MVGGTPSPDDITRELVGAIPAPMALSDPSGLLLGVNHHLCTAVGREEDELLRGGIGDLLDPRDGPEDQSLLRGLLGGEIESYQAHQRLRTGGGGVVEVRCLVWLAAGTGGRAGDRPGVLRLFLSVGPGDAGSARHAAVIVASSGDALSGYSIGGEITHWNPAAEQLYHLPAQRAVGRNMWEVLPADWAADVAGVLERVSSGERIDNYETSRLRPDGTSVQVALTIAPMSDESGRVVGASVVARDVTLRKRAESLLNHQARVLEMIAAGADLRDTLDAVAHLVDAHAPRVRCSVLLLGDEAAPRLRHGGGLRLAGLDQAAADELFAEVPGGPSAQAAVIAADLVTDRRWARCRDTVLTLGLRTCWSSPVVAAGAGRALGVLAVYCEEGHCPGEEDWELLDRAANVAALAIRRHRDLQELAHRAIHDPLTGAANRTLVADRLGHALQRLKRDCTKAAVLYLDLDRFKALNDRYGHDAGDDVLVELTERLRSVVRPGDTVARLGGDEFVVLCDPIVGELEAVGVADRVAQAVTEPFLVEDNEVHLTASVGIAFARDGDTAETVLGHADAAMYQAKERGKARFQVFDTAMHDEALARLRTEQSLRQALEADQFALVYQPLVELESEQCVGVEALLRWHHPQRGLLAPAEFLSVAEESGLIVPIGTWVLREACRQAARWQEHAATRELKVHVNVSARQLTTRLPEIAADALAASGADPARVCLEITETVLMADAPLAVRVLRSLKSLGLALSIDDFGTGYSSLSYVNSLPVDQLKIDRSFVHDLGSGHEAPVVLAVVGLAHALDLDVVAEGVETADQLERLRGMGCDLGQGFYWSPGIGANDLAALGIDGPAPASSWR